MDQSAIKKRVVRTIFGIAFAIVFIIFAIVSCKVAPHSKECLTEDDGIIADRLYGFRRAEFLERQPKLKEDPKEEEILIDEAVTDVPVEEPEPTEDTLSSEPEEQLSPAAVKAQALGLPAPPDIDINEWQYMLVNTTHTLSSDYVPELAYLNQTASETDIQYDSNPNRCPVDSRIAEPLINMAKACKDAGISVFLSSGYRSYDEQMYLYNRKVDQGYPPEQAKTIVAYPGTSEHQTGLCCDITDYYRETKDSSLENTETYKWLKEHCTEYGFIVRYPVDKSGSADSITGVIYEPWHFRYVGVEVARYITENNLCLEEFVALYE